MKKKLILFATSMALFVTAIMLNHNTVMADNNDATYQKADITVSVYASKNNSAVESCSFDLLAADNIRDNNGTIIINKDTKLKSAISNSSGKANFNVSLPVGRYYAKQSSVPSGYQLQDFKIFFEVQSGVDKYNENIYLPSNNGTVTLKASTPANVIANGDYTVTVSELSNNSNKDANNFVYIQKIPFNSKLTKMSTGTYSKDGSVSVYYQTNLCSDWKGFGTSSTKENKIYTEDGLGLRDDEYISAVMFTFGTVGAGFKSETAPVINAKVGINAKYGDVLTGTGELSAYVDGVYTNSTVSLKPICNSKTAVYVNNTVNETPEYVAAANASIKEQATNNDAFSIKTGEGNIVATAGKNANNIRTGDETPIAFYWTMTIVSMIVSIAAGIYMISYLKKRKSEK